jgi:hypothetical protein
MNINDITTHRLVNQQLLQPKVKIPKDIVGWMGAIQAQDYAMSKWAIGSRLPGSTDHSIEEAINNGSIIRTHILRPTWHLVSADDIHWMLELTAPHVQGSVAFMNRQLELDEKTLKRTASIIEKTLRDNNHLTREEIMTVLQKAKMNTDTLRGAHIMFDAELKGIVCNGTRKGKQFTYALLNERVAQPKKIKRDEALGKLALRYFTSHGPATLQDFIWWSGLPITDARKSLESVKSELMSETIDTNTYWFVSSKLPKKVPETLLYLPAYDEFMISYKDRTAALDPAFSQTTITGNGIFKPIIVVNGKVIGTWKRTFKKDTVIIENMFFKKTGNPDKKELLAAVQLYSNFLNLKTVIK